MPPPLTLEIVDDPNCQGVVVHVTDRPALARAIALVLVREFLLAKEILTGQTPSYTATLTNAQVEDIISRRLHPRVDYHRDGFLFQLIMWLSSHLDLPATDIVALPHTQVAEKGQDSIIVHRGSGGTLEGMSICEDKATENSQHTVQYKVWPEVTEYEQGGRWDELKSAIIGTLGLAGVSMDEGARLVRAINWDGKRRYRVRVTVDGPRTASLFAGFDARVTGSAERRRGETVPVGDLRTWMTAFATEVEAEVRAFGGPPVVRP